MRIGEEIISLAKEGNIKELAITAGETDLYEVKKYMGNRIESIKHLLASTWSINDLM